MYFIFVFIYVWVFNNYYLIKILVFWFIFNFKGYIIDGNLNVCINIYIKFFLIGIFRFLKIFFKYLVNEG